MTETVTVTPSFGNDEDGDPVADGTPFDAEAIAVAPGNTAFTYGEHATQDIAEYTVYLPVGTVIVDGDKILVRGRECIARVREWHSLRTARAHLEVLCKSATGSNE